MLSNSWFRCQALRHHPCRAHCSLRGACPPRGILRLKSALRFEERGNQVQDISATIVANDKRIGSIGMRFWHAQPQRAKPEHEVSGVLAAAFYVSSTRHEWQRVANQPRPPEGEASTPKTPQLRLSWRYAMRLMLSAIAMVIGLAIPTAASAECSGAPDMCIQESSSKIALYDGALRRLGPSLSIVHQAALSCEARCRRIRRQPARSICFCECAGGIPHVFRGRVLCE